MATDNNNNNALSAAIALLCLTCNGCGVQWIAVERVEPEEQAVLAEKIMRRDLADLMAATRVRAAVDGWTSQLLDEPVGTSVQVSWQGERVSDSEGSMAGASEDFCPGCTALRVSRA